MTEDEIRAIEARLKAVMGEYPLPLGDLARIAPHGPEAVLFAHATEDLVALLAALRDAHAMIEVLKTDCDAYNLGRADGLGEAQGIIRGHAHNIAARARNSLDVAVIKELEVVSLAIKKAVVVIIHTQKAEATQ